MKRLILGLIFAALWLPTLAFFTSGIYGRFWFSMTAAFTVALTVFVAVPLYWVLRKKANLLVCAIAGVLVGLVGSVVFSLTANFSGLVFLNWSPAMIVAGLMSGMIFWFVGLWRNDNLVLPPTSPRPRSRASTAG